MKPNSARKYGVAQSVANASAATRALMALQKARDAGGGAMRAQHIADAQSHIARLDSKQNPELIRQLQARVLALQGRRGDTELAHVTPGEVVIPKRLQTPEVLGALTSAAKEANINLHAFYVGSASQSENPRTGLPEFADEKDTVNGMEAITVMGRRWGDESLRDQLDESARRIEQSQKSNLPGQFIGPASPDQVRAMQSPPLTKSERFMMGLDDPLHAMAQDAAHAMPERAVDAANRRFGDELVPTAEQLDKQLQDREQSYLARRAAAGQDGIDYWRRVGRVVGGLPVEAVGTPARAGGFLFDVGSGFAKGLMNDPVVDGGENFWRDKIAQGAEEAGKQGILRGSRYGLLER